MKEAPKHIYTVQIIIDAKNRMVKAGIAKDGESIEDPAKLGRDELRFIAANMNSIEMNFVEKYLPEDNAEIDELLKTGFNPLMNKRSNRS